MQSSRWPPAALRDAAKTFDTSGKSLALFYHRAIRKDALAPAGKELFGAIAGKNSSHNRSCIGSLAGSACGLPNRVRAKLFVRRDRGTKLPRTVAPIQLKLQRIVKCTVTVTHIMPRRCAFPRTEAQSRRGMSA